MVGIASLGPGLWCLEGVLEYTNSFCLTDPNQNCYCYCCYCGCWLCWGLEEPWGEQAQWVAASYTGFSRGCCYLEKSSPFRCRVPGRVRPPAAMKVTLYLSFPKVRSGVSSCERPVPGYTAPTSPAVPDRCSPPAARSSSRYPVLGAPLSWLTLPSKRIH